MRFLVTIYGDESKDASLPSEVTQELLDGYWALEDAASEAGVLVESHALHPTEAATSVRVRDGQVLLSDGPFAETREQLGGYYLFDCRDMEEALDWAARIPHAQAEYGCVEVRPVMDYAAYGDAPAADGAEVTR